MLRLTSCTIALALLAGCGNGVDLPATHPVEGQVIYHGLPLEEATVTFVQGSGRPATGTTDAQGNFTLTTFSPGDGAIEGEHQVLVMKYEAANPNDPYAERKSVVPEKYADLKTSPLKQSVPAGGAKSVTIELTD